MTYPIKHSPDLAVSRKIPTKDVNNETTTNSMKDKIMDRRRKLRVKSYSFFKRNKRSVKESEKEDQRSVSFSSNSEEFYTLPLVEYTDEEFSSCFFNDEEYDSMMIKCLKVIQKIEAGEKTKKYCTRGLEKMVTGEIEAKDLKRLDAYIAVIETQEKQIACGYNDPEEIAQHYRNAGYIVQCHDEAVRIAKRDEKFVQRMRGYY